MNHSDMQHDHTAMINHATEAAQTHSAMHTAHAASSFWTWSNSLEILLIILVTAFVIFKKESWRNHKIILGITAFVFFISMHPLTDSVARHSVWLHCLQSSLVHHLLPLALLLTQTSKIMPSNTQPSMKTAGLMLFSLVAFNLMSLMWVLPSLHMQLMENGALYSAMKWAMAITGILLCKSMLSFNYYSRIAGLNYHQFSMFMLMPQALIGVALMVLPPLYPMPEAMMGHLAQTVALAQYLPHLSEQMDQILGGLLLLMATLLFLAIDLKRRRHEFSLSASLPIQKEIV